MTSTADDIEARWRVLTYDAEPDQREVDATSPLRMVIGVSTNHAPYLAVITDDRPGQPDLGGTVAVERRKRDDSRWVLKLELRTAELTDAFITLLSEVAEKCCAAPTETSGLKLFLETLSDWQALLLARTEHVSESVLRGLIAELWFGFQSGLSHQTLADVVNAWDGPLGGYQDYGFSPPVGPFEVKAVRPNATVVEISSAEQLDGTGVHLVVVTLDAAAGTDDALILPEQVHDIRKTFADGADRAEFNLRFANLFINLEDPWYREQRYTVTRAQVFDIGPGFPALRRSELPVAIPRTKYRLDLQFVSDFLTLDESYTKEPPT